MNRKAVFLFVALATAMGARAQTIAPTFAGAYSLTNLGTPAGIPANLGGLTVKAGSLTNLLIGGAANGGAGAIYDIGVNRDIDGHITSFSGSGVNYASAPQIDGGLAYGPGGVLFATTYANNRLLQYKPGSTAPDKDIDLSALGISASTGTIQFTPDGRAVIASYNAGAYYSVTLAPDGSGTYDLTLGPSVTGIGGGPEGIIYVPGGSPVFSTLDPSASWMLASEYGAGRISAYKIDANFLPISGTQIDFITGLSGAEGAAFDPTTSDFLFSTFGGGNQVIAVRGFALVPEPGSLALLALGTLGFVGLVRRRATTSD